MRIMLVADAWEPQVNGVVRTLSRVIKECKDMGHEFEIVSPADYDGSLVLLIVLVGLSVTFVLVLERVAGGEESAGGGEAT